MPTPTHPSLRLMSRVLQQSYLPHDIAYNIVDGIQERGAKFIQRVTRKQQTGRRNDLKLFNFYMKLVTLEKGLRTYNITDVNRFKNDLLKFMDDYQENYQENYRNGTINTIIPNILEEFTKLRAILNEIPITPFRDDQKEDVRSYGKKVRNIMRMIYRKYSSSTSILPPPRAEPASLPMGEGLKPKPKPKPKSKPKSKTKKARPKK